MFCLSLVPLVFSPVIIVYQKSPHSMAKCVFQFVFNRDLARLNEQEVEQTSLEECVCADVILRNLSGSVQ